MCKGMKLIEWLLEPEQLKSFGEQVTAEAGLQKEELDRLDQTVEYLVRLMGGVWKPAPKWNLR